MFDNIRVECAFAVNMGVQISQVDYLSATVLLAFYDQLLQQSTCKGCGDWNVDGSN